MFLYLLKEVMVKHIIVTELILPIKLAISKKEENKPDELISNAQLNKCKCKHAFQNSCIKNISSRFQTLKVNKSRTNIILSISYERCMHKPTSTHTRICSRLWHVIRGWTPSSTFQRKTAEVITGQPNTLSLSNAKVSNYYFLFLIRAKTDSQSKIHSNILKHLM